MSDGTRDWMAPATIETQRRSFGDPAAPARFWTSVSTDETTDCWNWLRNVAGRGYGYIREGSAWVCAHRRSYELFVGPIPGGLFVDHLCRNRRCVNPAHLEPVTPRENVIRSPISGPGINARKTQCIRGHEFTPANTKPSPNGSRRCRTCIRIAARRYVRKGVTVK